MFRKLQKKQTPSYLFFLRLIRHIFLLLLFFLPTFFIVKAIQLGLACPLLLSPSGHGELQALL